MLTMPQVRCIFSNRLEEDRLGNSCVATWETKEYVLATSLRQLILTNIFHNETKDLSDEERTRILNEKLEKLRAMYGYMPHTAQVTWSVRQGIFRAWSLQQQRWTPEIAHSAAYACRTGAPERFSSCQSSSAAAVALLLRIGRSDKMTRGHLGTLQRSTNRWRMRSGRK